MKSRRSSNLSLNAYSRRKKRLSNVRYKITFPLSKDDVYTPATPRVKTFSRPVSTQRKRHGTNSPFVSLHSPFLSGTFKKTPTKSPCKKRMRKSLITEFSGESNLNSGGGCIDVADFSVIEHSEASLSECHINSCSGYLRVPSKCVETVNDVTVTDSCETTNEENITSLWNKSISKLEESGLDRVVIELLLLISENRFPLDNIALKLFSDVVKWYTCKNTCQMRYSRESKNFWKLGYRLFGGRFLHFMGGPKNYGQLVTEKDKKGCLTPDTSDVNFAVPHEQILRRFDPYGLDKKINDSAFSPGILTDMIKTIANSLQGNSCCLTFDGKKIKQGLSPSTGDVDIFGFEPGLSLAQKKQSLESKTNPYQILLSEVYGNDDDDIVNLCLQQKHNLSAKLREAIQKISADILDVHDLRKKRDYAKEKLIERCGEPNWKNSRFVMAISSMIAHIHDIDEYLTLARSVLEEIIICLSCINGTADCLLKGNSANLLQFESYCPISDSDSTITRELKQRMPFWHERRKIAKITGSSMHRALGLDGHKQQQLHFDRVICGTEPAPYSDRVVEFMKYGEENEINAMATLVGKVLPPIIPGKKICEEGFVEIDPNGNGEPFMIVSPDGSVRANNSMDSTEMAVELKCPVMDLHKSLPPRYFLQCQSEMDALCVDTLLYLCWRPDYSSVFIVKKHSELYKKAYNYAKDIYNVECPRRQKTVSQETKQLKQDINEICKDVNYVEFVGLFPSIKHEINITNDYENVSFGHNRTELMLLQIIKSFETKHELFRQKATEAVVFLCSALDRTDTLSFAAPVCWFTKGYSLDSATMRNILEHVLNTCKEEGIHIPAISFDGQWHTLAVRDDNQLPLTKLQLQKDVWRGIEGMKKQTILAEIMKCNREPEWLTRQNDNDEIIGFIVYSKSGKHLPKIHGKCQKQQQADDVRTRNNEVRNHNQVSENTNTGNNENVVRTEEAVGSMDNSLEVSTEIQNNEEKQHTIIHGHTDDNILNDRQYVHGREPLAGHECEDHGKSPNNQDEIDNPNSQDYRIIDDSNASDSEQNPIENTVTGKTTSQKLIDSTQATIILNMLRTDQNSNNKGTWYKKTSEDVENIFLNVHNLKSLRDVDLRVIVRYLKKIGHVHLRESGNKNIKLVSICNVLGLSTSGLENGKCSNRNVRRKRDTFVKSLKDIAFAKVSKFRKSDLNIVYAEYIWPDRLSQWKEKALVDKTDVYQFEEQSDINHTGCDFFYIPAFNTDRNQYEVSCVDSSHLLTRTRRKCCKGGLDGYPNTAWNTVAKSGKTNLSLAMTECVIDQMSVRTALTHFSESVQNEMEKAGYEGEASLCKDIREWWRAEDEPGISAKDRVRMRTNLRQRLLRNTDFGKFPPPGMYVRGWPLQLWEALLSNIDAKTLLYVLSKQKTYNTRAFSSLVGETFFSELTLYDRRGQGTVTASEFQSYIGIAVEKLHVRLDKERSFAYHTSRKTVYPLLNSNDYSMAEDKSSDDEDDAILLHDHFFDSKERARAVSRKREERVSTERNAVLRGTLGVRWEKARRNDSKLLPTTRMGIDC